MRHRMGTDVRERRPNLRGSLARAASQHEQLHDEDWSATAEPSPAPAAPAVPERAQDLMMSPPQTPTAGVRVEDVMLEVSRRYDLNVEEAERLEWLIPSGLSPTIGHVFDTCEVLKLPRRSNMPTPTQGA